METSFIIDGNHLYIGDSTTQETERRSEKSNLGLVLLTGLSAITLLSDASTHINFENKSFKDGQRLIHTETVGNDIKNNITGTNNIKNGIMYMYNSNEEGFVMSSDYVNHTELDKTEKYFDSKIETVITKIENLQNSLDQINSKIDTLSTKTELELSHQKIINKLYVLIGGAIVAIPTLIPIVQFIVNHFSSPSTP